MEEKSYMKASAAITVSIQQVCISATECSEDDSLLPSNKTADMIMFVKGKVTRCGVEHHAQCE
ncbi:MAG: hypothetical protein ACRQFF_09130 [Sphaerochaeta sp.]